MERLFGAKTLYGEKWQENNTEKLSASEKNQIQSVVVETSERFGTKQLVFNCVGGRKYFKAHRDCANLEDGTQIDKDSVKLVELMKPSTGETTIHAYGEAVKENQFSL